MSTPVLLGHLRAIVPILAVYLSLSGNLYPANLVAGLLIATAISLLASPPPWEVKPSRIPLIALKSLHYVYRLLIDICKCGYRVARITAHPRMPIDPGVLAVRAGTSHPAVTAVSAHGITVTPGEMVIEIGDDGTLYTHCLDLSGSEPSAQSAQDDRARQLAEILVSFDSTPPSDSGSPDTHHRSPEAP